MRDLESRIEELEAAEKSGMKTEVEQSEWCSERPFYSIMWREEPKTGMLHFSIHLISQDGLNRGVILEVSPSLLYTLSEGCEFPHTRVTKHLLESQHATFDENVELKKRIKEVQDYRDLRGRRITQLEDLLRKHCIDWRKELEDSEKLELQRDQGM